MRWLPSLCTSLCLSLACTDRSTDDGASGSGSESDGSSSASTTSASSVGDASNDGSGSAEAGSATSDGGPGVCDPSDPDIGPVVAVTISNMSSAPIYLDQALGCAFVSPFSITHDAAPIPWLVESCTSCAAAIAGQCGCPGACAVDAVLRIDPAGRWSGEWPGAIAVPATLTPECDTEFCGPQCTALEQAEDGTYVFSAVASPTVDCGQPDCACNGRVDPAGWCTITGVRTGDERMVEAMLAYSSETSVSLDFVD